MITLLFIIVLSYILGTFPAGRLIARFYGKDIRTEGSGNVGATNVARTIGKKAGILTLLVDVLKGLLAVTITCFISDANSFDMTLSALFVVGGHCFSWPGVKGGKGVATSAGAILGISPLLFLCCVGIFIAVFKVSRIVSLASIIASCSLPFIAIVFHRTLGEFVVLFLVSTLVVGRHHENIRRLLKGEEKKFTAKQ